MVHDGLFFIKSCKNLNNRVGTKLLDNADLYDILCKYLKNSVAKYHQYTPLLCFNNPEIPPPHREFNLKRAFKELSIYYVCKVLLFVFSEFVAKKSTPVYWWHYGTSLSMNRPRLTNGTTTTTYLFWQHYILTYVRCARTELLTTIHYYSYVSFLPAPLLCFPPPPNPCIF